MPLSFSDMQNSNSGSSLPGFYIANDNCGLQVYTLSWNQATVFKPIASVGADGQIQPQNDPHNDGMLTDWITECPSTVRGVGQIGSMQLTFCTQLPEDEASSYFESPYERLYRVLHQYKDDPNYSQYQLDFLFKSSAGRGAPLAKPKTHALVQGVMYMHNGRDYVSQPRERILFLMSPSAVSSLGKVLAEGDIFNPETQMLHFVRNDVAPTYMPGWQELRSSETSASSNEFKHHACRVVNAPQTTFIPAADYSFQNWKPWSQVVRRISAKEQMDLLANVFRPEHILLAFQQSQFAELIPNHVLGTAGNTKVAMQQAPAPAAQPQMQPAPAAPQMQPAQAPQPQAPLMPPAQPPVAAPASAPVPPQPEPVQQYQAPQPQVQPTPVTPEPVPSPVPADPAPAVNTEAGASGHSEALERLRKLREQVDNNQQQQ